ncbi:hypothetical protein N2152v2_006757 [Parachlorella kessleri]
MKFGKYLEEKARPEWRDNYLDYKALKDLIKESASEDAAVGVGVNYSPRTTSLSVQRAADRRDSAEERFFRRLEAEVDKVGRFTGQLVDDLRNRLRAVQEATLAATGEGSGEQKSALLEEAKSIGDEFLQLEKYVNLNYMGFHKILKKHDKMLPHSPCRQFYISHLHNQPWVQGNYSDLLVVLSGVYSQLRGDEKAAEAEKEESSQGIARTSAKYWVRMSDVSTVKHHILQHLPVFQYDKGEGSGDAKLVNSVYFDNSSLELYHGRLDKRPGSIALRMRWYGTGEPQAVQLERKTYRESWKGDESQKERMVLPEPKVVPFLEGDYTPDQLKADLAAREGTPEGEAEREAVLLEEVQKTVDAKQLKPMVRTQYMRTAFQIPFDNTVRISLDTNVAMIKENPEEGPSCTIAGRWYRDPSLPVHRTEITRFPHAVLEIKLSLGEEEGGAPDWVQELLDSGLLTEVHKFSKFIHGTATLFPDMVQASVAGTAVPYWVDDESVRASMLMSAPEQPAELAPNARDQTGAAKRSKPRKHLGSTVGDDDDESARPLLGGHEGDEEEEGEGHRRLDLMSRTRAQMQELMPSFFRKHGRSGAFGGRGGYGAVPTFFDWWFSKPAVRSRPRPAAGAAPALQRAEPKVYLANERTFLSWLHMAVTLGSVAAALMGFTNTAGGPEQVAGDLTRVIALILLPVGILMCGYALAMFLLRGRDITNHTQKLIEDRRGPLIVATVVVSALSSIFFISLIDLVKEVQAGKHAHPPAPGPSPGRGFAALLGL